MISDLQSRHRQKWFNISNYILILFLKPVGFEQDNKMLVSSANRIGTDLSLKNKYLSHLHKRGKAKVPKRNRGGNHVQF
jgi:hypothetical protein